MKFHRPDRDSNPDRCIDPHCRPIVECKLYFTVHKKVSLNPNVHDLDKASLVIAVSMIRFR